MSKEKKDEKNVEEAPSTQDFKKDMKSQMASDSWKDAMAAQNKTQNPPKWNKMPSGGAREFEPVKIDKKVETSGGSSAGNIIGANVPPEELSEEELMNMVRELVRNRVKEVVRKKPGGGGYTLYAPNKGKKGKSKALGTFPTKMGAKRAELARFPPKDPEKLARLRRQIDRMARDPKKAAEKERKEKLKSKKTVKEDIFNNQSSNKALSLTQADAAEAAKDIKNAPSPEKAANIFAGTVGNVKGATDAKLVGNVMDKSVQGKLSTANPKSSNQVAQANQTLMNKLLGKKESIERKNVFYEKKILSTIIKRSLNESIFNEQEKKESEWDDYIDRLSKTALAGDDKFKRLQKAIEQKSDSVLEAAFNMIRKAVGKDVKLKNFGVKKDSESGKNYLAFSASFQDTTAEPIYIHIENGVPKIVLSGNAKIALTKTEPKSAKLFRAELVTVQERSLDSMDDLLNAIQTRDKYLSKLENDVDAYVAGLSPLQVSLLKQLLVKKYRKIS